MKVLEYTPSNRRFCHFSFFIRPRYIAKHRDDWPVSDAPQNARLSRAQPAQHLATILQMARAE
jgi:hypothetical protein